jgi:tRNA(adenine34) deaminase
MYFMSLALKEASFAMKHNEVPVGAIIVKNNKIISKAYNKVKLNKSNLYHAEMIAIKKANKKLKNEYLNDCIMYVTLEPCLMCAGAIYLSRIKKVVFALKDPKGGALVSTNNVFESKELNFKPEICLGPLGNESRELLEGFFKTRRK